MTLLRRSDSLGARRDAARAPLAPLASGLLAELQPLLDHPPDVPTEKALLSRAGGWCAVDGALLDYDPFDPRHRCPRCGRAYSGVKHDRFRLYWHHLWLAERALHAALLGNLLDHPRCDALASHLLEQCADRYLQYPNRDNVLGPSRPFFSTYLESIWLLQLVLALDLLEGAPAASPSRASLGARVRERLVAPSAELIASFDEGMSNRQVWNNAALLAAGRMLGRGDLVARAATGPSGLLTHLEQALLADGSWYEGENYHLFAHRGLWYAVLLAEHGGVELPAHLDARFMDGFAAPFRTILPDLTYPSRRDSPYAVSVRQLRFAESCELGLARGDDERLLGMLARLYDGTVPRTATGRATTAADVERNLPPTGLSRADLSWRSLLFARESLPALEPTPLRSDLLPAQGFAVIRRDDVYAALDFGHPGGGHGHPDRLNLLLTNGTTRWFDDPGAGSYVDRSLHWYRSTLAHTAPMVDGRSQPRVHGSLVAFDDQRRAGWMCADAVLAPGLRVRRSVVVLDDYLVDLLQWDGDAVHEVAMPLHGLDLVDDVGAPLARTPNPIVGGDGLEDGFSFLERTSRIDAPTGPFARARSSTNTRMTGGKVLRGWIRADPGAEWWSAEVPDVPSRVGTVPMLLPRITGARGSLLAVWSWDDAVVDVTEQGGTLDVGRRDGRRDRHTGATDGWRIDLQPSGGTPERILLRGLAPSTATAHPERATSAPAAPEAPAAPLPASFSLGQRHYRRTEESWRDAGGPGAEVGIALRPGPVLTIAVVVEPSSRLFVSEGTENTLDNEPAAINGDGMQLYLTCGAAGGAWLLVPRAGSEAVWVTPLPGWGAGLPLDARWRATAMGYRLDARIALPRDCATLALDLLINEIPRGRSRRRGQLVLSGAEGEFAYLRGDRHESHRLLRFTISDV